MKNLELAQESLAYGECCQSDIECEPCIKRAASFINGCGGHEMPYRREESRASDTGLYYTSPEKIPFEMIIYLNQNRSLSSNVERAVHAHYGIARIHPFEDGNGRLARLLQNTILHNGGLPPIIIHKYEKGEYLELMRAADVEFRENNGILRPRQVQFYNYLALKIAESLMRIRGACEGKK